MIFQANRLQELISAIFQAAGCDNTEASRIATSLVEANLVGHDSHGVVRTTSYIQWLRDGKIRANQTMQIVFENDSIAVVDGQCGYGQTVGTQAIELGIAKAARSGVAVIALRNSGHLGRIGDWPIQAARAGKLSIHFVNTSGGGILVAPFGGTQRRLSANPIAAGIPLTGRAPLILDMSTCTIAEGKIRIALHKGVDVPENCILDGQGRPSTDPREFYADPPGAILPIAGHKGYGLAVLCEVLAGALTGNGCSNPAGASSLLNGMLSIIIDPKFFQTESAFAGEIERFITWVKSSATVDANGEILMPGEIEERTRAVRWRDGIDIDETSWKQIQATAQKVGVDLTRFL